MKHTAVQGMKRAVAAVGLLAALVMAGQAMAAKQPPAAPVNINTAGVEELMTIPGVGPAKAQAIVAYRQAAPFASANDLVNVKGIGEKMFAKISSYVTVGGEANVQPGTAGKAAR